MCQKERTDAWKDVIGPKEFLSEMQGNNNSYM